MMAASVTRNDLEDAAQSALFRLAAEYNQRTVGHIIHALQRPYASWIFGGDYAQKSLWDELCDDAQSGPHLDDDEPWYSILETLLRQEVARLTDAELDALLLAAIADVDNLTTAPRDAGVIKEESRSALLQRAGKHNLECFEVW